MRKWRFLFLMCLCTVFCIYSNITFAITFGDQIIITTVTDRPNSVNSVDLDGDGDNDVLVASIDDDRITWFENTDGFGTFGPLQVISTETDYPKCVHSADLDGDGDYDVLSASFFDYKIAWYENTDGTGNFGPQQLITEEAEGANYVITADLDEDGDLDVLSASATGFVDKVAWYENTDGAGTFGPQQVISTAADQPMSIYCADLDGDNDLDVLSASYYDDKIAWYEHTDSVGVFGPQQVINANSMGAYSVYSVDIDGDGDNDVLSAAEGDWKVAWYENIDGEGTFGNEQIISDTMYAAYYVYSVDIDDDGDFDVFAASGTGDKVSWWENTDGLGNFGLENVISDSTDGVRCVQASDIDGDGDLDVLSASTNDDKVAWYANDLYGLAPIPFSLLLPDSGSSVESEEVTLEWEETTDPDNNFSAYWVFVSDNPDDLENSVIDSTTSTSYTFNGINGTEYWWSIAARDEEGNTTWADQVFSFTIELDPVWETEINNIPCTYQVSSIYPNPFNPSTTIQVGLPQPAFLEINVFNLVGQQIIELSNGEYSSGYHNFVFEGHTLSTGIYLVRVDVPGYFSQMRKVVLLK